MTAKQLETPGTLLAGLAAAVALFWIGGCSTAPSNGPPPVDSEVGREQHFQMARNLNTTDAYDAFLTRYPSGPYSDEARLRLERLSFEKASAKNSMSAYEDFLVRFPSGQHSEDARFLLEGLSLIEAMKADTIAEHRYFLQRFPHSQFAPTVRERLEILNFEQARLLNTVHAYEDFLVRFPYGLHATEAKRQLDRITGQVAGMREAAQAALSREAKVDVDAFSGADGTPRYIIAVNLVSGRSAYDAESGFRGPRLSKEELTSFAQSCCARVLRSLAQEGHAPDVGEIKISVRHGVRQTTVGSYGRLVERRNESRAIYEVLVPLSVVRLADFSSWADSEIVKRWTVVTNMIPKLDIKYSADL